MTERFTGTTEYDNELDDDSWMESNDAAGGAPPLGYDGSGTSPGVKTWQPAGRLPRQRGVIAKIDTGDEVADMAPEPGLEQAPQQGGWQPAGRLPFQTGTIKRYE